jgi:ABC-type multidrug transport system fused ATPase/permease subunit
MLMIGFLQWWYSIGWMDFALRQVDRLRNLADFFSIGLLLRTFFSPFKLISAYSDDNANIQQQFAEFFDKLLSRIIGAFVRFFIIIFGIIAIVFTAAATGIMFLLWPILPLMPVISVILAIAGAIA